LLPNNEGSRLLAEKAIAPFCESKSAVRGKPTEFLLFFAETTEDALRPGANLVEFPKIASGSSWLQKSQHLVRVPHSQV